jgi:hypothetical protein
VSRLFAGGEQAALVVVFVGISEQYLSQFLMDFFRLLGDVDDNSILGMVRTLLDG